MNTQQFFSSAQKMAPVVLRMTMACVVAWFGASQLYNSGQWASLVPEWALTVSPFTAETIVRLNGVFEIMAALFLALGILVRPVAFVVAIHLGVITQNMGLTPTGVRDAGLTGAMLVLALQGSDNWCILHKA